MPACQRTAVLRACRCPALGRRVRGRLRRGDAIGSQTLNPTSTHMVLAPPGRPGNEAIPRSVRCAGVDERFAGSVRVDDAVLGSLLDPARPWGWWPWKPSAWTVAGGPFRPARSRRHTTPGTGSRDAPLSAAQRLLLPGPRWAAGWYGLPSHRRDSSPSRRPGPRPPQPW